MRSWLTIRDEVHELLKRTQRRYHAADYEDLRLRDVWLARDPAEPFDVRTRRVAPDPSSVRALLVFKPDEIGDAVYALPAIAELRETFSGARFSLVCRSIAAPLYDRSGLFDEIATFTPARRTRPAARAGLRKALATLSPSEFDLAVYLRTYAATFREFLDVPARDRLHPLDPRLRSDSVYRARVSTWSSRRRHMALQLLEIVALATGREYDYADIVYPRLEWRDED